MNAAVRHLDRPVPRVRENMRDLSLVHRAAQSPESSALLAAAAACPLPVHDEATGV